MKVICIDDEFYNYRGERATEGVPKMGEVDTVVKIDYCYNNKGEKDQAYQFERFQPRWFDVRQFAPLSDIDETEFERNYIKETV